MKSQNLIIYKFGLLYHIFKELNLNLNFKIISVENEKYLNENLQTMNNCLIVSYKNYSDIDDQFVLDNLPINIYELVEKINIQFLKKKFNSHSKLKIKKYTIDLNSREMFMNGIKLKLTEKEIYTITYLFKSKKPISIEELQKKVWSYQSNLETHTVETHIYRLRKKIFKIFNDNRFIISEKNGYLI